jgi:hypothetical protein
MKKLFTLFLFGFLHQFVNAQESKLSLYSCLVGDEILWEIKIPLESARSIVSYDGYKKLIVVSRKVKGDSKASVSVELEILEPYRIDTVLGVNKTEWVASYRVMAWDTGFMQIPVQVVTVDGKQYELKTPKLEVKNIQLSSQREIYDIQEDFTALSNADEPSKFKQLISKYWWILVLALLLIGIYIYKKRTRRLPEIIKIKQSLLEETLAQLEAIEHAKIWQKDIKMHFTNVSTVFRVFNTTLFSVNFELLTTQQALGMLKQLKAPLNVLEPASRILDHSDMVKFAQSAPTEILIHQQMQEVRLVITQLFEARQ